MDEALKQLRYALKENPDFTTRTEPDLVGDFRLQRFLLARSMDVEKAKCLVEDHLKWRKEHHLEKIRAEVISKPLLVSSFPHAAQLKTVGMGMLHVMVNGGRSRTGELIHMEVVGGTAHLEVPEGKTEEYMNYLYEHYYGFFERRSLTLEELSIQEKRLIRGLQVRDFSQLSIMPQGGVFSVVRKILKSGLDNYPESASTVFFTNSPGIFMAIFGIVKHWLPEETKKKLHFCSGDAVPHEMLKHCRPAVVVALERMIGGEHGDVLAEELSNGLPYKTASWKKTIEKVVSARNVSYHYFVMSKTGTKTIFWTREDEGDSPKSIVRARIMFVRPEQENGVAASNVIVESVDFSGVSSITLPAGINEALAIIYLDHSASWFHSHKFRLTVEGA